MKKSQKKTTRTKTGTDHPELRQSPMMAHLLDALEPALTSVIMGD